LGGGGGNFGLAREEGMTGSGWRAVGDFIFFLLEKAEDFVWELGFLLG
jgi:hypothetical protein